jgi:hypothetical protein
MEFPMMKCAFRTMLVGASILPLLALSSSPVLSDTQTRKQVYQSRNASQYMLAYQVRRDRKAAFRHCIDGTCPEIQALRMMVRVL